MTWRDAWGTFARNGAQYDVAMVGGPGSKVLGLPLATAHASNLGRGIRFTSLNNEGTIVRVELSLVGVSIDSNRWNGLPRSGYTSPNGDITGTGWTYQWFADIHYSTDGGLTYKETPAVGTNVASHATPMALAYHTQSGVKPWTEAVIERSFRVEGLPSNFTHLKVEVRGDVPGARHVNIYTREQVVPPELTTLWIKGSSVLHTKKGTSFFPATDYTPTNATLSNTTTVGTTRTYHYADSIFKPWATRKAGVFKSHQLNNGWFRKRVGGSWVDVSSMSVVDKGAPNKGSHQIRKSSRWVGQSNIGGS